MKFLLLVSNSGGHIYPSLSLDRYLISKGDTCKFLIVNKSPSNYLVPQDRSISIEATSLKKLKKADLKKVKTAVEEADVVIGFGGFVSFIGIAYGYFKNKKTYVFEANSTLGSANRWSLPFVNKVFSYFPLKSKKAINIGTTREDTFYKTKLRVEVKRVLLLSGSLGSKTLLSKYVELAKENPHLSFTMSLGTRNKVEVDCPKNLKTVTYLSANNYSNYDLVVMRAGATTIAEMNKLGIPYILIPSPYVKNDHQRKNAYFMKAYGIFVIEEDEKAEEITKAIESYMPYEKRIDIQKEIQTLTHDNVLANAYMEIKK